MNQSTNQVEESVDLLICHATICAMDASRRVIHNGYVVVDNGAIVQIAEGTAPADIQAKQTIDATGQVLLSGFIDTHTHIFQSFFKGLGADHRLIEWLNRSALPYGALMTPYQHRLAAQLTCMEALKSGCTTLCEFFYTD
jgi:5-methylthioadenosine/S-adenosylhomocysteine deaminase